MCDACRVSKSRIVIATCIDCDEPRETRRRTDGQIPPRCKKCAPSGLTRGAMIGRATKNCWECSTIKPSSDFHQNKGNYDGLASECKQCCRLRGRARYIDCKDQVRERHLVKAYGITPLDYDAILSSQDGGCAICGRACTTGKRLAVDHNHTTGSVRGLLCKNCNQAIGLLGDDPGLIETAARYLRSHE